MDKSGLPEYRPAADDAFALPLKTREVLDKIDKYEHFITTKLEPDLNKTITERNALFKDIGEYVELKENITMIQRTNPTLEHVKTQFDLGSDFYVQAVIPDAKTVMVDTGVGVHVEFELTEAVAFIDKRVGVLESKATALNNKAAGIKSHMKLVRQGMQELAETVSADVKARQ